MIKLHKDANKENLKRQEFIFPKTWSNKECIEQMRTYIKDTYPKAIIIDKQVHLKMNEKEKVGAIDMLI